MLTFIQCNANGIRQILISLMKKKVIVEGSVLTRRKVLENEKRKKILDFIMQNPGSLFNHIVKTLQISNYVVFWHVNILEKFQFIYKTEIINKDAYFDASVNLEMARILYIYSKEPSKRILDYLKENKILATKTKISQDLNMHPNTATKYLTILEEIDLIKKSALSNRITYSRNENLISEIE